MFDSQRRWQCAVAMILAVAGCRDSAYQAPVPADGPRPDAPPPDSLSGDEMLDQHGDRELDRVDAAPDSGRPDAAAEGGSLDGNDGGRFVPSTNFFFFSDPQGASSPGWMEVRDAIRRSCDDPAHHCDFGFVVGDILRRGGVPFPCHPDLQELFEERYAPLAIDLYIALGNHDVGDRSEAWGPHGQAMVDYAAMGETCDEASCRAQCASCLTSGLCLPAEVDCEDVCAGATYAWSGRWRMPARYYSFRRGPVTFVVLDSTPEDSELGFIADQESFANAAISAAATPWVVVVAHHPMYSGDFEYAHHNVDASIRRIICEDEKTPRAQLYLSGHRHRLQWSATPCGGLILVAGGGGDQLSDCWEGTEASSCWSQHGFAHLAATEEEMVFRFVDTAGEVLYRGLVATRP